MRLRSYTKKGSGRFAHTVSPKMYKRKQPSGLKNKSHSIVMQHFMDKDKDKAIN